MSTVLRTKNKPFVLVPASPYPLPYKQPPYNPHVSPVVSNSSLKENTPIAPPMTQLPLIASASLKRKLTDRDRDSVDTAASSTSSKKAKLAPDTSNGSGHPHGTVSAKTINQPNASSSAVATSTPAANACPDYPNGFIYCHQCCKKRDIIDSIQCTVLESYQTTKDKSPRFKRCVNKYCRNCLSNRYDEDMNVIRSNNPNKEKQPGHADAGYVFTCPRCKDACNCPKCRKLKGLEAIGSLKKAASTEEKEKKPKKPKKAPTPSSSSPFTSAPLPSSRLKLSVPSPLSAPTPVVKPKPSKPLPTLNWTPLPISLSLTEAESRVHIREFILRFAGLLDPMVGKANLEELEQVAGFRRVGGARERERENEGEGEEITPWVSEACVKSVIMGLLGAVTVDMEEGVREEKLIKGAIKDLRGGGVNLNRIWGALASLRDALSSPPAQAHEASLSTSSTSSLPSTPNSIPLTFPDPLPPPPSSSAYNTRVSTRTAASSSSSTHTHISHTWQLIPVVQGLIDALLQTELIRADIENAVKEGKDAVRDAREGIRREGERWEGVRNGMESSSKDRSLTKANRIKREAHKLQLSNLENALKIIMPGFAPRFEALGRDEEGRVYYALSPGVAEREAAMEFMVNNLVDKPAKAKKRERVLGEEERKEMREWSWFVAVWGAKPGWKEGTREAVNGKGKEKEKANGTADVNGKAKANGKTKESRRMEVDGETSDENSGSEDSEDENELEEKWFGFWEPEEIHKLSEWISIKSGLDSDSSSDPSASSTSPAKSRAFKQNSTSVMVIPDTPSREQLKSLVKDLEEYAGFLEWRMKEEKYSVLGDAEEALKAEMQVVAQTQVEAKAKAKAKAAGVLVNGSVNGNGNGNVSANGAGRLSTGGERVSARSNGR
ncbi:hypothetical protein BDQ12DRAFT_7961 [Crucibulum laeve]|uniref:Zinc-finger domain-containing protein n=1 Tax=Crucibulum laeve TaxID=68775 RepID=A0A5C3MG61_9AGAR|nr:hypothetical protein BDQ12DRAFT_7961 [Crucibulum laeve]